ncbi:hypothetical protein J2S40_000194 [Nocardioides luteus]|uniref:Uncharacterized protein n=1 Tax=Nocardioides luteus TaxID=1844 RepID=A0ABQ5STQ5_9ACTN|nr:hypothetical protein [Nocardioides luteus]MDR7309136.1 hypothetical protein [Nocardioides luteus]GGR49545.1 hypothetical protein GCM10010197_14350 [Nocardioides luteus]GLJ67542.1 hypothetical protein GCM10017579_15780 [Nocardioides luteus]
MSRRTRRTRRRYVQRRRHWWRDLITSEFYNATHAWELDAEAESLGYETELEEYAATHPRPTLKGFMVALARPDRHVDPGDETAEHDTEEGQADDAAA